MDIMIDIETLGKRPGCVVLSIGAVKFDAKHGHHSAPMQTSTTFYRNIDVFSSLMVGLTIDPETLDWWKDQSDEARDAFFSPTPVHLLTALTDLNEWAYAGDDKPIRTWANSPQFDLSILEAAGDAVNYRPYFAVDFRLYRDCRTLFDALNYDPKAAEPAMKRVKHNALDDAQSQAEKVMSAFYWSANRGKETSEK